MKKILIALVLFMTLGYCRSYPPVEPIDSNSSALSISVELEPILTLFGNVTPQVVFFVKIDKGNALANKGKIYRSLWMNDNRAYLFNAEPGTYVAIASLHSQTQQSQTTTTQVSSRSSVSVTTGGGTTHYITLFPDEVIKNSRTIVNPGKLSYMGEYVVKMHLGLDEATSAQKFYFNRLVQENFVPNGYKYAATLKKQVPAKEGLSDFLRKAAEDFGEKSQWNKLLKN